MKSLIGSRIPSSVLGQEKKHIHTLLEQRCGHSNEVTRLPKYVFHLSSPIGFDLV